MWRQVISVVKLVSNPLLLQNVPIINSNTQIIQNGCKLLRNYSILTQQIPSVTSLTTNSKIQEISQNISRSYTKYSYRKGRRKAVGAVLKRFYRLAWGGWIRTIAGRSKRLWKKSPSHKRRLRQHVFCNATQSKMLDKMVGPYWIKRKYYVDDPYEPYHSREEFQYTYKIPKPYFPPEC